MKKKYPEVLTLPCHIYGCDVIVSIMIDPICEIDAKFEKYRLQIIKKAFNNLVRGHENGEHAKKCCCHHACIC